MSINRCFSPLLSYLKNQKYEKSELYKLKPIFPSEKICNTKPDTNDFIMHYFYKRCNFLLHVFNFNCAAKCFSKKKNENASCNKLNKKKRKDKMQRC